MRWPTPPDGTIAPFQKTFNTEGNGNTNAFVAAIAQLPSGTTVLTYSTYLGGLRSDAGQGIFFRAESNFCDGQREIVEFSNVVFNPTQAGNQSAVIQISDNAPGNPQTIPLTGSAVQAIAQIVPANLMLTFGSQLAGTTGTAAQNVTITNCGSGAAILTVSGATLNPATDFTLANNCTSGLAVGKNCTLGVMFTPSASGANTQCGSAAGPQSSVLRIVDNDSKSPQTLTLSGT